MWWFGKKVSVCEREGHRWNELAGYDDGHGGTVMRPFDKTRCLRCPAVYKAPPPKEPLISDKIWGLRLLLENYERLQEMSGRYPTYGSFGTYHFWLDYRHSLDAEIERLWGSL
jgi:hypothetical protein